jgi:CMP-N-acetylneuraminic acid synthetase
MMTRRERILAVIPARGGSKGVPRKNVTMLAGKPLLAYTIGAALEVRHLFTHVIVSTEDDEIASVALEYGAEVPFSRPIELAGDEASSRAVVRHAAAFIEELDGERLDWIMTLQPTAPLRAPEDIEGAIAVALEDLACDSVVSVVEVIDSHPIFIKKIVNNRLEPFCVDEREGTRRQEIGPPAFKRNGAIYLTRRNVLIETDSIWGSAIRPYVMPVERSVNIDAPIDLELARLMLSNNR